MRDRAKHRFGPGRAGAHSGVARGPRAGAGGGGDRSADEGHADAGAAPYGRSRGRSRAGEGGMGRGKVEVRRSGCEVRAVGRDQGEARSGVCSG